jgi:AraC family transcriptional regulator
VPARRVRHRRLAVAAQALMRADVTALHPIAQLARLLDTSSFHLAHVFRAEVGVSIHQYLMQLRFAVALDCLRHGAPDLSALALELGFSHHSHFSSVFRRAIGWSPREVRRMLTADNVTEFSLATRLCS